jgi:hypothetical protein
MPRLTWPRSEENGVHPLRPRKVIPYTAGGSAGITKRSKSPGSLRPRLVLQTEAGRQSSVSGRALMLALDSVPRVPGGSHIFAADRDRSLRRFTGAIRAGVVRVGFELSDVFDLTQVIDSVNRQKRENRYFRQFEVHDGYAGALKSRGSAFHRGHAPSASTGSPRSSRRDK